MCKVSEIRDCDRTLIFWSQGEKIHYPLPAGGRYMDEGDMVDFISQNGYSSDADKKPIIVFDKQPDTVYISDHAMERLRKRLGFNKNAACRMTAKAFDNGLTREEATGYLRTWIDGKIEHMKINKNVDFRIYGQYAFLFSDNVLITVYNMVQKESYTEKHERFREKKYNRSREKNKIRMHVQTYGV